MEQDSFCQRDTSPENASIENIGMTSLLSSKLYGTSPGKANFIGFSAANPTPAIQVCPSVNGINLYTTNVDAEKIRENQTVTGVGCTLGVTTYKMGVFGHLSGKDYQPIEVDHEGVVDENTIVNTAPVPATSVVCT